MESQAKTTEKELPESVGDKPMEEFESEHNVLGLFAILLAVDKRINPQNYEFQNKQND